ncbi:ABC transporter ATP-binding protein [Calycomorphotria hydatis]|uniref:Teichoic acids export ATP-binding protein TagH n=1 Tax=Calycomorphotria hydatis TaxID=2528027 RepID=A0A517TED7_9PLAN|nr:ABC transporter ATP-binding protein [Calycomorphotria hydatis]QDT66733.1 Teichoic acids export ATP-binding protein TagH [Calycomorphotria hydatis]
MSDILINIENVHKRYTRSLKRSLWYGVQDITQEFFGSKIPGNQLREEEFWAIKDLSFQVKRGECLGLIGPNGAGKSTLLKMINGLVKPDYGTITLRGRISALIELGAGFHPVLTGRENIYINGSILGMTKREIDSHFDEIVDFAEIGDALYAPVRTYSSGMRVRLGFAIAAVLKPDVLLIDEVLAVGDASFRGKCYNKIAELRTESAVILVSHNELQVSRLCNRAILLQNSQIISDGPTDKVLENYRNLTHTEPLHVRYGSGEVNISEVWFSNFRNEAVNEIEAGRPFRVNVELESLQHSGEVVLDITLRTMDDRPIAEINNYVNQELICIARGKRYHITVDINECQLNAGKYIVGAYALCENMIRHYDCHKNLSTLTVTGARTAVAAWQINGQWATRQCAFDNTIK